MRKNNGKLAKDLKDWIREKVHQANCQGVVLGLSGGIDSAVTAALCKGAFPHQAIAFILPCHSHPKDQEDAELVAKKLQLAYYVIDLGPTYETLLKSLGAKEGRDMATINIKPRLRMTTLYYQANHRNYLVVGTDNRSELHLGYFTKYGDGGVDIIPLGNLVKKEVVELAKELQIPPHIIEKPPSAGLFEGQEDEVELGFTYGEMDTYLLTGEAKGEVKGRIDRLAQKNKHKLQTPAIPAF